MSAMGQKVFEVQEDIIEMLSKGLSESEIDDIICEMHGESYRGMVDELLKEGL